MNKSSKLLLAASLAAITIVNTAYAQQQNRGPTDPRDVEFTEWKIRQEIAERRAGPTAMAKEAELKQQYADCATLAFMDKKENIQSVVCAAEFTRWQGYRAEIGLAPTAQMNAAKHQQQPAKKAAPAFKADIRVVTGCDGGKDMKCHTIYVTGDIGVGDAERFKKAIEENKVTRAVVLLNSNGGFLADGLAIGYTVKQKNFTTFVPKNEHCFSVCAAIWLAGSTRYLETQASIGFHGAYKMPVDKNNAPIKNGKPVVSSGGNAVFGAYLASLGLSDKAIYSLTEAGPDSMLFLKSEQQANDLGIKVTTIGS